MLSPRIDVVYILHGLGIETNVHLNKLMVAGDYISKQLGKPLGSKTATTALSLCKLTTESLKTFSSTPKRCISVNALKF
jgi:hypothetical protein